MNNSNPNLNPALKKTAEYPTEYLVARLRGKSGLLPKDWKHVSAHPSPLALLRDYPVQEYIDLFHQAGPYYFASSHFRWILSQMNPGLHNVFTPFFFYLQMKEIIVILRLRLHGDHSERVAALLQYSMLDDDLCAAIVQSADFNTTLTTIQAFLSRQSKMFDDITAEDGMEKGWKKLEENLLDKSFRFILTRAAEPSLKRLIMTLIDMTNLVELAKMRQWEITSPPRTIGGGTIPRQLISGLNNRTSLVSLNRFYPFLRGTMPTAADLEQLFLTWITGSLRRKRISGTTVDYILDHLWGIHINCRNVSLLLSRTVEENEEYIQ